MFSSCIAGNAIAEKLPCSPDYSTQCLVSELEKLHSPLAAVNVFTSSEPLPAFVLAVNYAQSGNLKKSKKFMRQIDEASFYMDGAFNSRRVVDLLVAHGEDERLIEIITSRLAHAKDRDTKIDECSNVVQWLAFKRKNDLLVRVVRETECTTLFLSGACRYLDEKEMSSLLNALAVAHGNLMEDKDKNKFFESATVLCISRFAHEENNKYDPTTFTEHLLSLIDYEYAYLEDKLRNRLVSVFFLRKGYFDLAEQEAEKIQDAKLKMSTYEDLRGVFIETGDERVSKYDDLIGNKNRRKFLVRTINEYPSLIEKLTKLNSDFSIDKKRMIIDSALETAFAPKADYIKSAYTSEEKLEILGAIQSFLEKNYDYNRLNEIHRLYIQEGSKDLAAALEEKIPRFKQERALREEKSKEKKYEDIVGFERAFQLESRKERANELARQILLQMTNEDNFAYFGRVILN